MRLIDADKLKRHYSWWQDSALHEQKDIFDDIVDLQPTIIRPKGNFEYLGETKRSTYVDMHKCSNCNYVALDIGNDYLNYCPNCGADMRGEEE